MKFRICKEICYDAAPRYHAEYRVLGLFWVSCFVTYGGMPISYDSRAEAVAAIERHKLGRRNEIEVLSKAKAGYQPERTIENPAPPPKRP